MSQLNIHMTPDFEKDLRKFMKMRHLKTKAEAIRTALKECLQYSAKKAKPCDFQEWIGLGLKAPINKNPRFQNDDDLWGTNLPRKK